jgi:hypothetical protein
VLRCSWSSRSPLLTQQVLFTSSDAIMQLEMLVKKLIVNVCIHTFELCCPQSGVMTGAVQMPVLDRSDGLRSHSLKYTSGVCSVPSGIVDSKRSVLTECCATEPGAADPAPVLQAKHAH